MGGSTIHGLGVGGSTIHGRGVGGSTIQGLGVAGSTIHGWINSLWYRGGFINNPWYRGRWTIHGLGVGGSTTHGMGVGGSKVHGLWKERNRSTVYNLAMDGVRGRWKARWSRREHGYHDGCQHVTLNSIEVFFNLKLLCFPTSWVKWIFLFKIRQIQMTNPGPSHLNFSVLIHS